MVVSVKLALTALLAGNTLAFALPGGPGHYSPPPYYTPGGQETCHTHYETSTYVTTKPYTTVVTKYTTKTIPYTTNKPETTVITGHYTHETISTGYAYATVPAVYTRESPTTKIIEKSYQCPHTKYTLKPYTHTETYTTKYKTTTEECKTYEKTKLHKETGYTTKTKESVYKTHVPYTTYTQSPCTETITSKHVHSTYKLKTKTHTKIWTEVETIPVYHTRTITQHYVHTTTKTIVTSRPTHVTTHYKKRVPYTHSHYVTKTYTTTKYIPTYGIKTETKTIVHTRTLPEVYPSECSSKTQIVTHYPVVYTTSSVKKYETTKQVPCTETTTETKVTTVPKVYETTTRYQTVCTETPYHTYHTTTVIPHKVCSTSPPAYYTPGH